MSDRLTLLHSTNGGEPAVSKFSAIDTYLTQQANSFLVNLAQSSNRLSAEGWQVQRWGKTIFATAEASKDAPTLLVYLPDNASCNLNLSATLAAVHAWRETETLPVNLKLLIGPVSETLLVQHRADLTAQAIVYSFGEYTNGRPLITLGLKGLLEVELRIKTLTTDAPSAYAEVMPGAAWLLVRALDSIKSDVQEVKIDNFEDNLRALPVEESRALLKSVPEHAERLVELREQYGLNQYLFELGDALVLQTKYLVPTVNISAIKCGTFDKAGRLKLAGTARARLDFHLVPDQNPDYIFALLQQHLIDHNFDGVEVFRLPGSYQPTRTPLSEPFVQRSLVAASSAARQPTLVVPISPFSGRLAMIRQALDNPPAICIGLDAAGTNIEADFVTHSRFLAYLLPEVAELYQPGIQFNLPIAEDTAGVHAISLPDFTPTQPQPDQSGS